MSKEKMSYLIKEWLTYQRYLVKESTYARYIEIINNHIMPYFGNISYKKVTKNMCFEFNNYLLTKGNKKNNHGLSNKMVKDINTVLQQVLNFYNININIKSPKVKTKDITIFNDNEFKALLDYCLNKLTTYNLGVIICLYTGLRIGEICALKWENIDLEKDIITIKSTIQRIKDFDNGNSKVIISDPKSNNSIRMIPINKILKPLLIKMKSKDNYYILTNNIKYIEPRSYYRRYKTILRKLHLDQYTFHTLRHTFATRCAELGIDAKSLSELLGHSNVKTTLTLYVHPSLDVKKIYMDRLSEI